MPHQDQSPKLGSSVDLGVSAGPRPLERTPMTTSIASFDASTILVTNESTNPVTTSITPSTLYIEESSILYINKSSILYESSTRNIEEPNIMFVMTSILVDNPDDNLIIYPENSVIPRHPDLRMKLGYLGINDRSEEIKLSVIYGKIDGRIAHIMLDSGCNIYVLSIDFANAGNVPCFSCKPVPVELVVWNASQFTLNIQIKKLPMEIDNITQSKASYVLSLPSYDAIFGMSFLNDRKLVIYSEKSIITLDDMKLFLVKDHDEPPRISTISRSRFKTEIRKNEIIELYLTTTKITSELNNTTTPDWIKDKYSDIFLDGLLSDRSFEWKAMHEILLHPNSLSQFRRIFRLFQVEFQEFRKQFS